MFAQKIPRLAIVGLRSKSSLPSIHTEAYSTLSVKTRRPSTSAPTTMVTSTVSCPIPHLHHCSVLINSVSRLQGGVTSPPLYSVRSMSSNPRNPLKLGSIMEHPEYKEMYEMLSKEAKSSLDIVCCHILSKNLIVNLDILELDALSPSSHSEKFTKGNAKIKDMEESGAVKVGKFNIKDDVAIKKVFEALVDETKVDKKALVEELFAENEAGGRQQTCEK